MAGVCGRLIVAPLGVRGIRRRSQRRKGWTIKPCLGLCCGWLLAAMPSTCLADDYEVAYSTYPGGSGREDTARAVAVDTDENIFVAGGTTSADFPTTPGAYDREYGAGGRSVGSRGPMDVFVTKLDPRGRIVWSTYFGTPGKSTVRDMDIDSQGNVYVSMIELKQPSAHITRGAFQERPPGGIDSLVAKISATGSRVIWCSYLGGSGRDLAPSLRIDADGHAVVAGSTFSDDFPVSDGAFQTQPAGKQDAFVAKFSADGSRLVFSTRLGGSQEDGATGKHGLALDRMGRPYVVGFTSSADFPTTPGAFQRRYAGGMTGPWRQTGDRFVAVLSADGSQLDACTLIGGGARDGGEGIEVGPTGRIYLGGLTFSTDFPTTPGAIAALPGIGRFHRSGKS